MMFERFRSFFNRRSSIPLSHKPYAQGYETVAQSIVSGEDLSRALKLDPIDSSYRKLTSLTINGDEEIVPMHSPYFYVPTSEIVGWPSYRNDNDSIGSLWMSGPDLAKWQIIGFKNNDWPQVESTLFKQGSLFVYYPTSGPLVLMEVVDQEKKLLAPVDKFSSGEFTISLTGENAWWTTQLVHPAKVELSPPKKELTDWPNWFVVAMIGWANALNAQFNGWSSWKDQLDARKYVVGTRIRQIVTQKML